MAMMHIECNYFIYFSTNTLVTLNILNTFFNTGRLTKMDDNFAPYLCGGVLFSFLVELHKYSAKKYNAVSKTDKTVNQTKIMEYLIRAIDPNYCGYDNQDTFKKNVSEYRSCKSEGGDIITFGHGDIRDNFDKSVRKQYRDVLERMTEFTDKSFPTCNNKSSMCFIIKNILTIIREDDSIEDNTLFFIMEDGSPISKEEICKKVDFNFQSFLVGTWHYVITKPTKNENGKQTFEKLFPKYTDKERKLDTNCLTPYDHDINITVTKVSKKSSSKETYQHEIITVTSKTNKNEELAVKIYYKGSLLEDTDEKAILSNSPEIIDLNKHPDISINDYPNSTIYKITTEFQFKTHFPSPREEIIRLYCNVNSLNISGTTSFENWKNRSKLNEMRFHGKYSCTAWFRLIHVSENEYSAEFLLIGSMIQ